MDDDTLIKVENVKKKYCRSLKRSMQYGLQDIARDLLHLQSTDNILRQDEFWSLNNISFEVKRGECLGIIGANGAGKSTLLKLLNGIILPDAGEIITTGRVCSLIEVGSGFHPMLSGKENIYINGSILGMSNKEIDEKFDSIVEFAELEDSIDMPVKHYSSGMYVRLGFAIAAHVQPDILILDEILAVGDISFIAKCFRHLSSIKNETAIILVSHDMRNISRIADKALLLSSGIVKTFGPPAKTISSYRMQQSSNEKNKTKHFEDNVTVKYLFNKKVIQQFEELEVDICLISIDNIEVVINIIIHRSDGTHCCSILSDSIKLNKNSIHNCRLTLTRITLMPGNYKLSIIILSNDKIRKLTYFENISGLCVIGDESTEGIFKPTYIWSSVEK